MQNKNQVVIYGRHAVFAALANPQRSIVRVVCLKENAAELRGRIGEKKLSVVERRELEKMLPREAVHQGMAAVAEMLPGISLEELCEKAREKENCHLLVLDQVTDPQNIGAIIRSCAAFDALALMVQDKNSPQESGAMLKAAAGTFELLPVCRVTNLSRAVEKLKKYGRLCQNRRFGFAKRRQTGGDYGQRRRRHASSGGGNLRSDGAAADQSGGGKPERFDRGGGGAVRIKPEIGDDDAGKC